MIIFIFNTLFHFLTLIAYSWFTSNQILFKFVFMNILIILLYLLYKYPKPLEYKLDIVANYYKIHNNYNKILSFTIVYMYLIVFLGCIFYLRYLNRNKKLDLCLFYTNIYTKINKEFLFVTIFDILLIIIIIITYIYLIIKITNFVKKHVVKLYIYYSRYDDNYVRKIVEYFSYRYNIIFQLSNFLYKYLHKNIYKKIFGSSLEYHFIMFILHIHYIILICVIFYDIIFNNWVLHSIFVLLPYIFLYDVYTRLCKSLYILDCRYSADYTAHDYIYVNHIEIINDKEVFLDGDCYEIENIYHAILVYVKHNLNGHLLVLVKEGQKEYSELYYYNYYKDWINQINNSSSLPSSQSLNETKSK